MEPLLITPKTKIHDLLEAYPGLEDVLIQSAPQFRKLRNPLLRKTIARVTSLSQAAIIGGLKVEELINTLRAAAGQQLQENYGAENTSYHFEPAQWFSPGKVKSTMDIGDMLHAGEQPVHEVLSTLKQLQTGEILELRAPFIPAPLLDKAIGLGYDHWINEVAEDEFLLYFIK